MKYIILGTQEGKKVSMTDMNSYSCYEALDGAKKHVKGFMDKAKWAVYGQDKGQEPFLLIEEDNTNG